MPRRAALLATDACAFCVHARSLLVRRGVTFEEVELADGFNEPRAADRDGGLASWSA